MTKKSKTSGKATAATHITNAQEAVELHGLDDLLLDATNPRLGAQSGQSKTQKQILDTIVKVFGVDDVLSSLAVNGYFHAEPLVGVRVSGGSKLRIAEGNRRLAACLILAGDPRAQSHERRTKEYGELQRKSKKPPITEVPVLVHSDESELLSYLGVRHIAGASPWDSYAKAAWVAKMLAENPSISVEDISGMIGDQHQTVARILEGFYFINQLVSVSEFNPTDSERGGRGSNPEFPFSWIYTTLGYKSIRNWLGLSENVDASKKKPLKRSDLSKGGQLITMLLGNKTRKQRPAIDDSRQIPSLAKAIADPASRKLLIHGKTVDDVAEFRKPAAQRVEDGLLNARDNLQNALQPLSEGELGQKEAEDLEPSGRRVKKLAADVHKRIVELTEKS